MSAYPGPRGPRPQPMRAVLGLAAVLVLSPLLLPVLLPVLALRFLLRLGRAASALLGR